MKITKSFKVCPRFSRPALIKLSALIILSGLVALPLCGCGKKPIAASAMVVPLASNSPVFRDPAVQANLQKLNAELVKYTAKHGMPESFQELVANEKIQVPAPPQGMCYLVSSGSVTLGLLRLTASSP
jgi:hypothetical protein